MDERDRLILRRTLGVASWLYAAFGVVVALMLLRLEPGGEGIYAPRTFAALVLAHAVLLGAAGEALARPRRWALPVTLLAAAGALFFAVLEAAKGNALSAALDGGYALLAVTILLKTRASP